jgi:hypothetical protein
MIIGCPVRALLGWDLQRRGFPSHLDYLAGRLAKLKWISMRKVRKHGRSFFGFFTLFIALTQLTGCDGCNRGDVTTQHNDIFRTGAYLSETRLTPKEVLKRGMRGRYLSRNLDENILTQPLYVRNVAFSTGNANGVFVATRGDWVYAFNADDQDKIEEWRKDLITLIYPDKLVGGNFVVKARGVNSTPVIDVRTNRMYVLFSTGFNAMYLEVLDWPKCEETINMEHLENLNVEYFLAVLDLRSGELVLNPDGSKMLVSISLPKPSPYGLGLEFVGKNQMDRPGLLLDHGSIYLAFGSLAHAECRDEYDYHGWVFRYRATDLAFQVCFALLQGRESQSACAREFGKVAGALLLIPRGTSTSLPGMGRLILRNISPAIP